MTRRNKPPSKQERDQPRFAALPKMINNYFSGSPLNRLSWLRTNQPFLSKALKDPRALFLPFNDRLEVLVNKDSSGVPTLQFVSLADVEEAIPLSKRNMDGVSGDEWDGMKRGEEGEKEEANSPILAFLGVEDGGKALPEKEVAPEGVPVWAIQLAPPSPLASEETKSMLLALREGLLKEGRSWSDLRAGTQNVAWEWSGVYATARHILDWNARHRFCASCGRTTRSVWAGWKRACIPDSHGLEGKTPCVSVKQVHNFSYPRTDPVVIMAVLSSDRERILLGRQKRWPAKFYSCLAGFLEPGESLENAVRREVLEEAGINVAEVAYHSSQPWPYPSSLMLGCIAVAAPSPTGKDPVPRLDLDNELEDARWIDRSSLVHVLQNEQQAGFSRQEIEKIQAEALGEKAPPIEGGIILNDFKSTRLPPATAIAHQLIKAWAMGELQSAHIKTRASM